MFWYLRDNIQYTFFLSFDFHLVNNVSDQSQVSISDDKSFCFQTCLKTFCRATKKSDKNWLIFLWHTTEFCRPI